MKAIVSAEWLYESRNNPHIILLDASPKSNKSGLQAKNPGLQLPNARVVDLKQDFSDPKSNLPNTLLSEADFEQTARRLGINEDSYIVVYDNLGMYAAPRVWWMFKTMGHEQVAVLDGGLDAWVEEGYPTVAAGKQEPYTEGNFKANFRPEKVVGAQQIADNLTSKKAIVLDARSAGRFKGTTPEPRAGLRGGHIPNSLSLPFKEVLDGKGYFKSEEALKAIFDKKSISDQPLIFSCGSGLTACIIHLAADLVLDNPMAIYDGSWTDWAQLEDMPVEL